MRRAGSWRIRVRLAALWIFGALAPRFWTRSAALYFGFFGLLVPRFLDTFCCALLWIFEPLVLGLDCLCLKADGRVYSLACLKRSVSKDAAVSALGIAAASFCEVTSKRYSEKPDGGQRNRSI